MTADWKSTDQKWLDWAEAQSEGMIDEEAFIGQVMIEEKLIRGALCKKHEWQSQPGVTNI